MYVYVKYIISIFAIYFYKYNISMYKIDICRYKDTYMLFATLL